MLMVNKKSEKAIKIGGFVFHRLIICILFFTSAPKP